MIKTEQLFKLLADTSKLKIFMMLMHDEYCVCDIEKFLSLKQANVSKHLMSFKRHGLVEGFRENQWIHYRLTPTLESEHEALYTYLQETKLYKTIEAGLSSFEKELCHPLKKED